MDASEDRCIEQNLLGNCRFYWTAESTKLLLEEVRNKFSLLNKKNYMQKKVWRDIAINFNKRGYNVTDDQCSTKWKNLKQKYKNVRENNNGTGRTAETWEYFDIIDEFLNIRPEVLPVSIASSTHGFRVRGKSPHADIEETNDENNPVVPSTSYGVIRNVRKRQRDPKCLNTKAESMVVKLYKQREEHHKKNIEMQEKFLTLFEKHLQKNNRQLPENFHKKREDNVSKGRTFLK